MDKLQKGVMFSKTEAYNRILKLFKTLPITVNFNTTDDFLGTADSFLVELDEIILQTDSSIKSLRERYGVNNEQ